MSWREESEATARHLARLLTRDGHVPAADLDAALTGRRAVLDLARTVHLDVTGLGSSTLRPTLEGLVAHPVQALGQLLHRQPRPHPDLSLSVLTARSSADATGKLWERVAVHACLAEHHWGATSGRRPRFVKQYLDLGEVLTTAVRQYADDVAKGTFPGPEHNF